MPKKIFETSNAPFPIGPYCQSMEIDGFVFCSGQIPMDPKTNDLVEGGIKEQTKQVMENIKAVLTSAGLNMKHVVKTTVFLTSLEEFAEMNEVYASYFSAPLWPVRSCVEVSKLPKNAKVEIEIIASRRYSKHTEESMDDGS